jgi:hypothetical protein
MQCSCDSNDGVHARAYLREGEPEVAILRGGDTSLSESGWAKDNAFGIIAKAVRCQVTGRASAGTARLGRGDTK